MEEAPLKAPAGPVGAISGAEEAAALPTHLDQDNDHKDDGHDDLDDVDEGFHYVRRSGLAGPGYFLSGIPTGAAAGTLRFP